MDSQGMNQLTYLRLLYTEHSYYEDESDPDEWSRPSSHTEREIEGLLLVDSDAYATAGIRGSVQAGEHIFALVAQWSSGDSFGMSYNCAVELINVYRSKSAADYAKKVLEETPDDTYDFKPVQYLDDAGNIINYTRPWTGYFDRLVSLEVYELPVELEDDQASPSS